MSSTEFSFTDIQNQWQERVKNQTIGESFRVRLHRSLSWAQQMETHQEEDRVDEAFLCSWIALNALFARWDDDLQQCLPERQSMQRLIDQCLILDQDRILLKCLQDLHWHIEQLLSNKYLDTRFWRELDQDKNEHQADDFSKRYEFFLRKGQGVLLSQTLLKVYLMRNQLMHGAATYNSDMNRHTLLLCSHIVDQLLRRFLFLLTDGYKPSIDLGGLPYPPVKE